jgi:branched-chain amino acid transport system substrate-binding protein
LPCSRRMVQVPTTAAMNEVFGVAKVPLIGTISGTESLRQSPRENPNNRYMFNVRASYANETEAIVNQLVSLGFKNIAVSCTRTMVSASLASRAWSQR